MVQVFGTAATDAAVMVNGQAATRQGENFYRSVAVTNTAQGAWSDLAVSGVRTGGGPGGVDAVGTGTRQAWTPKTPEVPIHDADGNLTGSGQWTFTWDAENRLAACETRGDILPPTGLLPLAQRRRLEFGYDSQGRRVSKKVFNWNGAAWVLANSRLFVFHDWNMVAELNALSSNAVTRTFAWGADLSDSLGGAGGVGGLVFANLGGTTHAPSFDGNGNVITLTDIGAGVRTATYDYDAFGQTVVFDGPAAPLNPWRFSTKWADDETELLYYGYRYYQPNTGRWLSRDPIEEEGGVYLFGFISNDVANRVDLLGLKLETYSGDVTKLTLSPSRDVPDGFAGLHHATIEDFKFRTDVTVKSSTCSTGYGLQLEFSGRLKIELIHKEGVNPDENIGRDGLTTSAHERKHAAISKEIWNSMVNEANIYEGCYCKIPCFKAANRIVNALLTKANAEMSLKNSEMDFFAYGRGMPAIRFKRDQAEKAMLRAQSDLEEARIEFRNAECSIP